MITFLSHDHQTTIELSVCSFNNVISGRGHNNNNNDNDIIMFKCFILIRRNIDTLQTYFPFFLHICFFLEICILR